MILYARDTCTARCNPGVKLQFRMVPYRAFAVEVRFGFRTRNVVHRVVEVGNLNIGQRIGRCHVTPPPTTPTEVLAAAASATDRFKARIMRREASRMDRVDGPDDERQQTPQAPKGAPTTPPPLRETAAATKAFLATESFLARQSEAATKRPATAPRTAPAQLAQEGGEDPDEDERMELVMELRWLRLEVKAREVATKGK